MTLRTHCRRGHPLTEGNYAWRRDGTRRCLLCQRLREQRREARNRELRARAWEPRP
jgi:hypothetical protein